MHAWSFIAIDCNVIFFFLLTKHYRGPCLQEAQLFLVFAKGGDKALSQSGVVAGGNVLIASKTKLYILLSIPLHEVV